MPEAQNDAVEETTTQEVVETEVETEEVEDQEDDDTTDDQAKLEHVKKLRSEAKNLRARTKAAEAEKAELQAKVDEFERAKMTEDEKLEADRAAAKKELQDLRVEKNVLKIQKDFPVIDDDLIGLIAKSEDYDAMAEAAKTLAAALEAKAPKGKTKGKVEVDELTDGNDEDAGVANPREVAKAIGRW